MNPPYNPYQSFILGFFGAGILTICTNILLGNVPTDSLINYSIIIRDFSWWWVLPAGGVFAYIGTDHQGIKLSGWTSEGHPVYTGDGEIIPGDPETAAYIAHLWLLAYPIGYFYYTNIKTETLSLTGFPNIDWIMFIIVFPLLFIFLIFKIIILIHDSSFWGCKSLIFFGNILVLIVSINLLGWIIFWLIGWLYPLIIDFVSWLFNK